jgi:succinate dehydrogenase / fumarate reductase membrane anchor subunit
MSLETPLHRVEGLGSAHSGVSHFWRQRVTAVALIPLSIWFAYAVLSRIGAPIWEVRTFFQSPLNAVLMGLFVLVMLIHMVLGLQMVIDDYVYKNGQKIALMLLVRGAAWLIGAACLLALLKIAI